MFQALLANSTTGSELRATLFDELALRAMHHERFVEAEALFKQAFAINTSNAVFRIHYVVLLMQLNRLDEARGHLGQILAAPQTAAIVQLAEALKQQQRIETSPEQNVPEPKTAPGNTNGFLLQELAQPKESLPFLT
ncbi:MAG: tetratricopeptide repeat protein [Candidatus Competibacteraceae bacterium]